MKTFCLVFLSGSFVLMAAGCQRQPLAATPSASEYRALQQTLTAVYESDQGVRDVDWNAMQNDSVAMQVANRRMQRTDSVNQAIVLPLLERYGWLPQSQLGEKPAKALFYVVQHSNTQLINRYLPLMEEQAKHGEASATAAATMRDRLLMFEGKKQLYGTQAASWVRPDGAMVIWPIRQPDKVDALRKQLGFKSTVQENARALEAIYDPQERIPAGGSPFRLKGTSKHKAAHK